MKNRFSRWPPWRPSWISDRKKFSYFISTSLPDASYQVSSSGEEAKNRFSRRPPWQPYWISDQKNFTFFFFFFFLIYKSSRGFVPSFKSNSLSVQEKKRKIDFQDCGHLGFPIGSILGLFNLQVTMVFLPNFESFGLLVQEKKQKKKKKKDFQDGRHGR